ncbi:MAG TPA: heme-binding protein [Geminicoccaceae bacterium]
MTERSDHTVGRLATPLSLAQAATIVDAALAAGRTADLEPLTVAVLDAGGHLIALKREDGSGILRPQIAIGKAWGALGMGVSSRTLGQRLAERASFQAALSAAAHGRFVAVPGGVLVRAATGEIIGAVGVSGDTSDKDEYAAITGVRAAGLEPDPPAAVEDW